MSKFKKVFIVGNSDVKDHKITLRNIMFYMLDTTNDQSKILHLLNEDLLKRGLTWMIYKWDIKIFDYPRENEKVEVITWASRFKNLIAYREFEIYRDNKLIGFASTEFVLVDFKKKKPIRISEDIRNAYGIVDEKHIERIKRINPSENIFNSKSVIVEKEDIDINNHVNNLCYVDYIKNSLNGTDYENKEISELKLSYTKEITYPNKVKVIAFREKEGLSFILSTDVENAKALIIFK